jgi:MFS family permease
LILTDECTILALAILQAISGIAAAFFNPASVGIIPEITPKESLQQANSLLGLLRNATGIGALAASGALVATTGPGIAFAIDAGTFLISSIAISLLKKPRSEHRRQRTTIFADLRDGWREFSSKRWIVAAVLHIGLLNLVALAPFFVLGPLIADKRLGGAPAWAAVAICFALGAIAGGLLATRIRPARPLIVAFCAVFLIAPQLLALAIPASLFVICVAASLGGLQATLFEAVWLTTVQRNVSGELLSRVNSFELLVTTIFAPIGYALAGPAAELLGTRSTLIIGAGWVVISTIVVLAIPSVRTLTWPEEKLEKQSTASSAK